MTLNGYQFHRRAFAAFQQMSEEEQEQVSNTLALLTPGIEAAPPSLRVTRIPGLDPLYLVPINDDLRVILLALPGQQREVLALVRREALQGFAR